MTLLTRLLRLAAANGIPGGGYFLGGWSPATALALYWVDTLIGAVATALRIALHRRTTGAAGHQREHLGAVAAATENGRTVTIGFRSFLAEFVVTSFAFTIAHGLFLAAMLGFFLKEPPDAMALREGAIGIGVCQAIALTLDLARIDQWRFARLKQQAMRVMQRVVLVQFAIIGGMAFLAFNGTDQSFFGVFVVLKLLSDIGNLMPEANRKEPPRWLARIASKFPKQKGETFEQYWRRTRAEEAAAAERDEEAAAVISRARSAPGTRTTRRRTHEEEI